MNGVLGSLHIYCGQGKGKTTAALGLSVRALGAGFKVLFIQFIKNGSSSEFKVLKGHPLFTCKFAGSGRFLKGGSPSENDIEAAEKGFALAAEALKSGEFQLVVLDEAMAALSSGLLKLDALTEALKGRAPGVEVVLTGRNPPPELMEMADLVTEMRCVKHYYQAGRKAAKGIEF